MLKSTMATLSAFHTATAKDDSGDALGEANATREYPE